MRGIQLPFIRVPDVEPSGRAIKMEFSALEWFALVVLALTISKIVWNIGQFFYTTFIGHLLGLTLDLRNYGPWAGKFIQT